MKRILMALTVAAMFCSITLAQQTTTVANDEKKEAAPKKKATVSTAITVSSADNDTVMVAEFTDTPDDSTYVSDDVNTQSHSYSHHFDFFDGIESSQINTAIALAVVFLIFIFSFPLFVIFIAFYFRYRSRKARYKLVEQALAAGQPIPEGVFKESLNLDTKEKGIKNMCLGIGLFIFLWALTNSFAMGCIGLLIMFTGVGQYLVARSKQPTDEQK